MEISRPHQHLQILAHRGLHGDAVAANSLSAFERAITQGYGIEVDLRDNNGELVVAHDMGEKTAYPFEDLCPLLSRSGSAAAINIKSCGLHNPLKDMLERHGVTRYFTFDMAVPDLLSHIKTGLNAFTRQSEYEPEPALYGQCPGIWLDMFEKDWVTEETIHAHAQNGKAMAIVSPELHKRPHAPFWQSLKDAIGQGLEAEIYLCTEHPQGAAQYFHG